MAEPGCRITAVVFSIRAAVNDPENQQISSSRALQSASESSLDSRPERRTGKAPSQFSLALEAGHVLLS